MADAWLFDHEKARVRQKSRSADEMAILARPPARSRARQHEFQPERRREVALKRRRTEPRRRVGTLGVRDSSRGVFLPRVVRREGEAERERERIRDEHASAEAELERHV